MKNTLSTKMLVAYGMCSNMSHLVLFQTLRKMEL